jgi:protein-tyrosine phosphatase
VDRETMNNCRGMACHALPKGAAGGAPTFDHSIRARRCLAPTIVLLFALCVSCASVNSEQYIAKVDGNLYRGSRQEDLNELLKFKRVINLEEENAWTSIERDYCAKNGIEFVHIPMSEWSRPSSGLLYYIATQIWVGQANQDATLVHCRRGKDRTGYAIAAYRIIVQGWEIDAAYEEMLAYGHASMLYFYWKSTLEELAGRR